MLSPCSMVIGAVIGFGVWLGLAYCEVWSGWGALAIPVCVVLAMLFGERFYRLMGVIFGS